MGLSILMSVVEEEESFTESVPPQKIGSSYYVRLSVLSRMKRGIDSLFKNMNKPLIQYHEEHCEGCSKIEGKEIFHVFLVSKMTGAIPAQCVNQMKFEEEQRRKNGRNY